MYEKTDRQGWSKPLILMMGFARARTVDQGTVSALF